MVETPESPRRLIFTGERKNRRYLVKFGNKSVWLSASLFAALSQLALGQRRSATGYCTLPRLTIHRLRQTIRRALSMPAGDELIETGADSEYRLRIDPRHVHVDPSFVELRDKLVLDPGQIDGLLCWLDEEKPD